MVSVTVRPVVEVVLVAIASLALLATLVVGGLAASSDAEKYGFKNGTAQISDKYFTQVSRGSKFYARAPVVVAVCVVTTQSLLPLHCFFLPL